jgi:hypothetical protein
MIDNPDQAGRLLARLQAALPLPARVTPDLAAALQAQNPATDIPPTCSITWISYAGDEGGIVCRLDFARETEKEAFVSITHLRFDPRLPLARDIANDQKHRVKRLRRQPS